METIIYQGREVEATLANYLDCVIPTSTVDNEGEEDLFRDSAGQYYLRQTLKRLDHGGENERETSGRTRIHRISTTAAILWATTRLNSETLDLRTDAARLLSDRRRAAVATLSTSQTLSGDAMRSLEAFAKVSGADVRDVIETAVCDHLQMVLDDPDGSLRGNPADSGFWACFAENVRDNRDWRLQQQAAKGVHELVIAAGGKAMTLSDEALAKVTKFAQMTNSDVRDVVETVVTNGMSLFTEDDDGTGNPRLSESWASFTADVQDEGDRRLAVLDHGQTRASAMKWNTSEDLTDGGMVICLHLKPEPARLMRAACLLDERSPMETIYLAMASDVTSAFGGGREAEAEMEAIFDDNAPQKEEPSSGMAVRLDKEATEVVQRYLKATPRDYTIGDIVSGAVIETMEEALENLPEAIEWGCLDGDRFHDGAWGYLDDKIMRAQFRREDRDPGQIDEMNWFRSPAHEAKETAQPGHDRHPQPDFSLNAAAPEPVKAPEPPPKTKAKRAKGGKEQA